MAIEMSNRVFLITEKSRISTPIKIALNSLGLEIETEFPALTSIPVMRTGISKSGKTAFIRTELLRFIKAKGYPRAVILDNQIELGPDCRTEQEKLKIFKTFLIAYIILSKGADLGNIHGNFLLISKGKAFEKKHGIDEDPHRIMNMLSTQNPEISVFLDELRGNRQRFLELFTIAILDSELSSDIITDNVRKFITGEDESTEEITPSTQKKDVKKN